MIGWRNYRLALDRERIAGAGVVELGDGTDVAHRQGVNELLFLADHYRDLGELLVAAGTPVVQRLLGLNASRQNPEDGDLAYIGVGNSLEDLDERIAVGLQLDLGVLTACGYNEALSA